jgi:hypothetical protein
MLQVVAGFLIAFQALVSIAPANVVLCFDRGSCDAAATARGEDAREETGCCAGCQAEGRVLPTPMPPDTACPAGCDCCLDIELATTIRGLDLTSASADLQRVLIHGLVCTLAAFQSGFADGLAAPGCAPHPPDWSMPSIALGLRSTRLII